MKSSDLGSKWIVYGCKQKLVLDCFSLYSVLQQYVENSDTHSVTAGVKLN